MKELIHLHIGQCGVQIGNSVWELFGLEHDIEPDGQTKLTSNLGNKDISNLPIFSELSDGKFVPRSVMVDLDDSVIHEVRTRKFRNFFKPSSLISGKEDSADIYARGFYTIGKEYLEETIHEIRKLTEECSCFAGFLVTHSVGGGTGSGFCSLLLENLSVLYGKKPKIAFTVYNSERYGGVVEPYNTVLSTHSLLEHVDLTILVDNSSLYRISEKCNFSLSSFKNINRIVADVVNSTTSPLRFFGSLNMDINELQTNLVPYPRMHFCTARYGPFSPQLKNYDVQKLTNDVFFDQSYSLSCLDPKNGKYLSVSLMYRGEVFPSEIIKSINTIKSRFNEEQIRFELFAPNGFKVGITSKKPIMFSYGGDHEINRRRRIDKNLCMISCNTAVEHIWNSVGYKFDSLFGKRAFLQWYSDEGMDIGEFFEAREDIAALSHDHKDFSPMCETIEEEEEE